MSSLTVLSVVTRGMGSRSILVPSALLIRRMMAFHGRFSLPRCCQGCTFSSNDSKMVPSKTSELRDVRTRRFIASQRTLRRKKDAFMKKLTETEIIKHENVYTIPNFLCIARIIACPYLGFTILQEQYEVASSLFVFAGVTDFLDGFIARHYPGQASKLGSFLDPLADKVLVATVFLTLTYNGVIPGLLTIIIVARDILLVGAGFYIRYRSLPPPKTFSRYFDASFATAQLAPTQISKVNTFVQLGMIVFTLAAPVFGYLEHPFLFYLWWLTGATTILSAGSYVFSSNTYTMLKKARASGTKVAWLLNIASLTKQD